MTMMGNKNSSDLTYSHYLMLETLLSTQHLRSVECNRPAHHEHLFIITHQVYELWFKQIIYELDSIRNLFILESMKCNNHYEILKRLRRITLIQKLLIDQFAILETMTSSDFLEFRDLLHSASGFQSLQFRLIENKLGLTEENRTPNQKEYLKQCWSNDKSLQLLIMSETEPSLFDLVQSWLEQFPWKMISYFCFRESYRNGIRKYCEKKYGSSVDKDAGNHDVTSRVRHKLELYESLFDEILHKRLIEQKRRRFSQRALLGAIAVTIYHSEPEFNTSYQILNFISDVDLHLISWRNYHILVVQKMIGPQNSGTGGSSGYSFLQSTLSDEYRIFFDLFCIPTFLVPRTFLPSFEEVRNREIQK